MLDDDAGGPIKILNAEAASAGAGAGRGGVGSSSGSFGQHGAMTVLSPCFTLWC